MSLTEEERLRRLLEDDPDDDEGEEIDFSSATRDEEVDIDAILMAYAEKAQASDAESSAAEANGSEPTTEQQASVTEDVQRTSLGSLLTASSTALLQSSSSFLASSSSKIREHIARRVGPTGGDSEVDQAASTNDKNPQEEIGAGALSSAAGLLSSLASKAANHPMFTSAAAAATAVTGRTSSEPPVPSLRPLEFVSDDFSDVPAPSGTSSWAYLAQTYPERSVQIRLRPDVSRQSLMELFETIVMSHGMVVTSRSDEVLTVERPGGGGLQWTSLLVKVGVGQDKLPVAILQFLADAKLKTLPSQVVSGAGAGASGLASSVGLGTTSSPALASAASGGTPTDAPKEGIGAPLLRNLGSALMECGFCLSKLNLDEEIVVCLDAHYVRDLQAACADDMMSELQAFAGPLDAYVKEKELRCARLMTMLQPVYARAKLSIPHPTRAKGLNAFALETSRQSITEATLETARQLINKTQSLFRKERVTEVIRRMCRELDMWCDEERRARIKRKRAQVLHRLENVEAHRSALIKCLRDSPEVRSTAVDKQFASSFGGLRAANESVLFDFSAAFSSRPGRAYISFTHLWFTSFQIIGFGLVQRVLPFSSITKVELGPATALGGRALILTDARGERHSLLLTTLTPPDFPERVLDVLSQVMEVWRAEEEAAAASQHKVGHAARAALGEGSSSELGEEAAATRLDPETLKAFQSLESEAMERMHEQSSSSSSSSPPPPQASGARSPEARGGGSMEQLAAADSSDAGSSAPLLAVEPLAASPVAEGSDGGGRGSSSMPLARPKSLRQGIEAFLVESQGKRRDEGPLLDFLS